MIVTTTASVEARNTASVEARNIVKYLGIVSGEAVMGANIVKDLLAGITDIVGGRASAYERELKQAKKDALDEMIAEARALGADGVVGIDLDYQVIAGDKNTMLMVSANGTAVELT